MDHAFWKQKRVAVPGGGGFLGSRLVARLEAAGAEVFVPRTADGVDFRRDADCNEYCQRTKPAVVINCAAIQGGIGYHRGKEADLFLDNMRMGLSLMNAARAAGAEKFVNVVAGCSYPGYGHRDELNEEEYWDGPVHESIFSYGFARKASVAFGAALKRQYGWNSIHLLLANMYGPGEHFEPGRSKALAGLMKKIQDAKEADAACVTVWGTGRPVRDWLYVEDGADGVLRAAEVYNDVEPVNIATGAGVSVKELAELIARVAGYTGTFHYDDTRPDGALKKTFGVRNMKGRLNWCPRTSLREGIQKTWDWLERTSKGARLEEEPVGPGQGRSW